MKSVYTESKICPVCQRPFTNRKKWASRGLWPSIKYCSERCRNAAPPAQSGNEGQPPSNGDR